MNQTKLESLIEQFINVGSGYITAYLVWIWIVIPLWDIKLEFHDNVMITLIFTVVSVIRGYLWRRFFNKGLHRSVHSFIKGVLS